MSVHPKALLFTVMAAMTANSNLARDRDDTPHSRIGCSGAGPGRR